MSGRVNAKALGADERPVEAFSESPALAIQVPYLVTLTCTPRELLFSRRGHELGLRISEVRIRRACCIWIVRLIMDLPDGAPRIGRRPMARLHQSYGIAAKRWSTRFRLESPLRDDDEDEAAGAMRPPLADARYKNARHPNRWLHPKARVGRQHVRFDLKASC